MGPDGLKKRESASELYKSAIKEPKPYPEGPVAL